MCDYSLAGWFKGKGEEVEESLRFQACDTVGDCISVIQGSSVKVTFVSVWFPDKIKVTFKMNTIVLTLSSSIRHCTLPLDVIVPKLSDITKGDITSLWWSRLNDVIGEDVCPVIGQWWLSDQVCFSFFLVHSSIFLKYRSSFNQCHLSFKQI